jgi:putative transposase
MTYPITALEAYLAQHHLVGPTADYIIRASAGLARDIGTGGFASVVTEYQSRKMGVTVNTESRTGECAYAIHLDFDPAVEAFFEQPPAIDCYRKTKAGHTRLTNYFPDFLVLGRSGPFVVQVKDEKTLQSKVASSSDWVRDAEGRYHDLAADRAFALLGLPHVVISTSELNQQRVTNILLLLQSLQHGSANEAIEAAARKHLATHPVTTLSALAAAAGTIDLTPLIRMVATHSLFTDLSAFALTQPDACFISKSPSLLREDVIDAFDHLRRVDGRDGETGADRDRLPLSKHLARGVNILEKLDNGAHGRSARRWRARIRAGEANGINSLLAVTPHHHLSGNRKPKRPDVVLAWAENVIRTEWGSDEKPTPSALWRSYKTKAEQWHPDYKHLSRPTFMKLLNELKPFLANERGGRRAANAAASPSDVDDRAMKPTRPFELASCDHYLCDIHCVVLDANGMNYAMQSWLTVLRDVCTKSILAFWLSLRPPSRRSCALIIRQCLRNHGRLPETIIVDRGADFRSNYFSALMAHCSVHLMLRPAGHPRFGSEAERFFGEFKDLWLSLRPGNRVSVQELRAVSGSHHPKKLASLSLLDLWEDLSTFNHWLDHATAPSSMKSPHVLMQEGLALFSCSGKRIAYDDSFLIASAVDEGRYKLDPSRGLHIDAFHFWHPSLAGCRRPSIDVRRDPQDPYRVYALVEDQWVTCRASASPVYDQMAPLKQTVEGVVMLDGARLREIVRDDADRNLMAALQRRNAAPALPFLEHNAPPAAPGSNDGAQVETDYFAEVAKRNIEPAKATSW